MTYNETAHIKLLDNPFNMYYPGDTLHGTLNFYVNNVVTYQGIHVIAMGVCNTQWTGLYHRRVGYYNTEHYSKHHKAQEVFYRKLTNVLPPIPYGVNLYRGRYKFAFSFLIFEGSPCSFEHTHGNVRYYVTVEVINHHTTTISLPFTVLPKRDLTAEPAYREPVVFDFHKCYCPCCIPSRNCRIVVTLPHSGYYPGDTIRINLEYDNRSRTTIRRIQFELREKLIFYGHDPEKWPNNREGVLRPSSSHSSLQILAVQHSERIRPGAQGLREVLLTIPESVQVVTLDDTNLIDVVYEFEVTVEPEGRRSKASKIQHITLGTRSRPIPPSVPASQPGYRNWTVTINPLDRPEFREMAERERKFAQYVNTTKSSVNQPDSLSQPDSRSKANRANDNFAHSSQQDINAHFSDAVYIPEPCRENAKSTDKQKERNLEKYGNLFKQNLDFFDSVDYSEHKSDQRGKNVAHNGHSKQDGLNTELRSGTLDCDRHRHSYNEDMISPSLKPVYDTRPRSWNVTTNPFEQTNLQAIADEKLSQHKRSKRDIDDDFLLVDYGSSDSDLEDDLSQYENFAKGFKPPVVQIAPHVDRNLGINLPNPDDRLVDEISPGSIQNAFALVETQAIVENPPKVNSLLDVVDISSKRSVSSPNLDRTQAAPCERSFCSTEVLLSERRLPNLDKTHVFENQVMVVDSITKSNDTELASNFSEFSEEKQPFDGAENVQSYHQSKMDEIRDEESLSQDDSTCASKEVHPPSSTFPSTSSSSPSANMSHRSGDVSIPSVGVSMPSVGVSISEIVSSSPGGLTHSPAVSIFGDATGADAL